MAGENEPNPWIAAGQAAHDRAVRTQDQAIETQDQGVATQDEAVGTQDQVADREAPPNNLRAARGHLTQQQLSDRSGVPRDQIGRIETGARRASPTTAQALADALGTTPEALALNEKREHPVATARKAAGLTQRGLAERTGLNQATIAALESGGQEYLRLDNAHRVASALSTDIRSLGLLPDGLHPVAERRWEEGLTASQVAERAGVSRSHLNHIESGAKSASPATAEALASVLGSTPEALGFMSDPSAAAPTHPVAVSRLAAGMTPTELAERANVSPSYISRIESGQMTHPRIGPAHAIAAALGTDVRTLGFIPAELHPLAERRWERGFTQEQLAEASGIARSVVARIEDGRKQPDAETLAALGAVLDGDQPPQPKAPRAEARPSKTVRASAPAPEPEPQRMVTVSELADSALRREREALGMSRAALAEAAGVSKEAIAGIETGRTREPWHATVRSLQSALIANGADFVAEPDFDLQGAREALGVSGPQLAERAGIARTTLREIEVNGQRPTVQVMDALRAAVDDFASNTAPGIREQREQLGLTQIQLATRAGIQRQTLAGLESGELQSQHITRRAVEDALSTARDELGGDPNFDVAAERHALGLTQGELAGRAGVISNAVSELERGETTRDFDLRVAVRRALDEVAAEGGEAAGRLDFDVAEMRSHLGLTQTALAERAGVHEHTVANAETGKYERPARATVEGIRTAIADVVTEITAERNFDPAPVREAFGLTVDQLAARSGIGAETIRAIERGDRATPRAQTMTALRTALADVANDFANGRSPDLPPDEPSVRVSVEEYSEVRRDREVGDLTVEELAELSGVPVAVINRIEAEPDYQPGEAVMRALREGFNQADVIRYAEGGTPDGPSADAEATKPAAEATNPAGEVPASVVEGRVSVPVGPLRVEVPDAPARPELPAAPPLPPHLTRLGEQAAYFDASMRGFPAGREAGAAAAAAAEVPWGQEAGNAGRAPVLSVDHGGERLAEARRTASENDVGADEQVGVDWEAEAPLTAPVGAADAARGADALREATFSPTGPGSGLTAAEVHQQRFEQSAWDGFQQGWTQTMAERALLEARNRPELAAPDVTPDLHADALAAIGHAPGGTPPQAAPAAGLEARRGAEAETGGEPGGAARPGTASGERGVDDPAPRPGAPGPETSGSDPAPEPAPQVGMSGPAGPVSGADPAILGLSTAATRSTAAPEQSVAESEPAPAPTPAPELSTSPALEREQSKE
ncbi:helix-turn-helix domain-containing protein [Streptodolium elevatio]|uniref:Helix-turn-helix domain-containing protein n=1 Tax=Streptodolium elevatio TaxID=3157996 RepID=A0ABV3DPM1_9ACTN